MKIPQEILDLHRAMDERQQPVIYDLAVTQGWGWGRIIQICHQQWDKKMEDEYGIKNHSRDFQLAGAMVILEQEAKKHPEKVEKLMKLHDELADVLRTK